MANFGKMGLRMFKTHISTKISKCCENNIFLQAKSVKIFLKTFPDVIKTFA